MSSSIKTEKIKDKSTTYRGVWNDNAIRNHLEALSKSVGKASSVIDKATAKTKKTEKKEEEPAFKFDEEFSQRVLNKFPDNKEVEEALEKGDKNTISFFLDERLDTRGNLDIYMIDVDYLDRGLKGFEDLRNYILELKDNRNLRDDFRAILRNSEPKESPSDAFERFKAGLDYSTIPTRFGNIYSGVSIQDIPSYTTTNTSDDLGTILSNLTTEV